VVSLAPNSGKRTYLLDVIHVSDGGISLGVLGEANEAETTAATGVAVLHDDLQSSVRVACGWVKSTYSLLNLTILLELGAESGIISVPCEATIVAS
jgi:hypothetical protein